jgi:DNA-binding response OmpR family regulator
VTRLLVVDDDPDLLDVLIIKLGGAGFEISSAADGETAIETALALPPDLIVLDWALPGLDGLEVCAELRRHPQTRDVPVILLTAKAQERDVQRGLAAGVMRYVTKPFSPRQVLQAVEDCLAERPAAPG